MEQELRMRLMRRAEAYGLSNLAKDAGLSRQALHSFFEGGDIRLSNFLSVLRVLNMDFKVEEFVEDSDVLANLKAYGAPLVTGEAKTALLPEESLVEGLKLSREDARLTSVLPYLLVKRAYQWDQDDLLSRIKDDVSIQQLLGYYVDVALAYRKREPLAQLKMKLKKLVEKAKPMMLAKRDQGKNLKNFERFDNSPAREWKLGTRDDLESLVARCKKWERLNASS